MNDADVPAAPLPHWDMTAVFPAPGSAEYLAAEASLIQVIDEALVAFERHSDLGLAAFEPATVALERALEQARTIQAYIYAFVATDSRDAQAQSLYSALQQQVMRLTQLGTRYTAWIGTLDLAALVAASPMAAARAGVLRRAQQRAAHQMSPDEEALAAELNLTGALAWSQLHATVTSQLSVALDPDGRELPMSAIRNLAGSADRAVRRRAHEAELAAWERAAVPLAAALNAIKGQVGVLARRRGWESPLATSLFDNAIDAATLDAMLQAAREAFPDFRRYLRAKARLLGVPQLAWYDVFAPVGDGGRGWPYATAQAFILEQFGQRSPRLRQLAERAFAEGWIDAEPRAGKVDGAFCMRLRGTESRILANYTPTIKSVLTLAHELGHAYHNLNLADQPLLNQETPMTLAETASIFCETIVRHAALERADADGQLEILEASLAGATQVVIDITSRFTFERAVFDGRRSRALSIAELDQVMLAAQRDAYGDAIDDATLHPKMWAVKGHYYSGSRSFYNYPYMFGLLFGLGLYALRQQHPASFDERYDALLATTGTADAAELAQRMGIDIRSIDFWRASLALIRDDIDRFEALVAQRTVAAAHE